MFYDAEYKKSTPNEGFATFIYGILTDKWSNLVGEIDTFPSKLNFTTKLSIMKAWKDY
jgi:hypothetical protein